ncbi:MULTISPECIES: hypothetical protein [unclassified Campylobacter]|uniref:hypothetical protein n=1 Tax=unclassified Campylobacter TaxID=2593542 RepID=UPI001BDA9407|nr:MULTISPECIES: hypothetical protein [unclassified Campylobacter]MBT0880663.1 hypothetical protein [Campylobacter sp. 2018MI27]MBT0884891.1 hypothetical protein [Campylobacter sp. 2018MI10]
MFFRIVKLIFVISLLCLILALCYFALTYNFISNNTDPLEEFNELKTKLYRIEADLSENNLSYYDFNTDKTYKIDYNKFGYKCKIEYLERQKLAIKDYFNRHTNVEKLEKVQNYKSIDEIKEFSKDLLKTSKINKFNNELVIKNDKYFYDEASFVFETERLFVKYYYFDENNDFKEVSEEFFIDSCGYIENRYKAISSKGRFRL